MVVALGNGVIGNTAVSGTVIQGSSPCSPTKSSTNVCEDLRSAGVFFFPRVSLSRPQVDLTSLQAPIV